MPQVLISCKGRFLSAAEHLRTVLETEGYSVMLDVSSIDDDVPDETRARVEACTVFLCMLSHDYDTSPRCRQEMTTALLRGKYFVVLVMEDNYMPQSYVKGITAGKKIKLCQTEEAFLAKLPEILRSVARGMEGAAAGATAPAPAAGTSGSS